MIVLIMQKKIENLKLNFFKTFIFFLSTQRIQKVIIFSQKKEELFEKFECLFYRFPLDVNNSYYQ